MALPNLVQIKQALDKMMPELSPVPIGSIAYAHEVPTGWLECNGAEISRTKYARLFKKIGTKYGAGDGSTTFNLPNLHHRVLEATTTISEVAKTVEAGLPDIVGKGQFVTIEGTSSGAIAVGNLVDRVDLFDRETGGGLGQMRHLSFKASSSNALHGKSSTNQMASLRLIAIIKF